MNIDKIKDNVKELSNKKIKFKFNGNRNQIDEFTGKITNTYKAVFLVKIDNDQVIRSFTYTDILIGNLEINV